MNCEVDNGSLLEFSLYSCVSMYAYAYVYVYVYVHVYVYVYLHTYFLYAVAFVAIVIRHITLIQ